MHTRVRVPVTDPQAIERALSDLRRASLVGAGPGLPPMRATVVNLVAYAGSHQVAEEMAAWVAALARSLGLECRLHRVEVRPASTQVDDLLGETETLRTGGESLRVLEVRMVRHADDADAATELATLQELDGVVEVILHGKAPLAFARLGEFRPEARRPAVVGLDNRIAPVGHELRPPVPFLAVPREGSAVRHQIGRAHV